MYARVPKHIKGPFEARIRKIRFRSALRLYLPAVGLFVAFGYLAIAWKGHGVLALLRWLFGDGLSETRFVTYFFYGLVFSSAVGVFFLLRHLVTKELYHDYLY